MPARADRVKQILMGVDESPTDTREYCVDGAGRHTCLEELSHELNRVTTRDTVADRQRRDGCLEPWPEMASGDLAGKQPRAASTAARTAHTLAAMLDDADRDDRQLFDLMVCRLTHRHPEAFAEYMAAIAARRPVIDDLIDRPRWQHRAPTALMAWLPARIAPRTVLPAPRCSPRGISAGRPRRVPRILGELTLELLDPHLQLLDTPVHRQQDFDYSLTPRPIDRLRLRTLHTPIFDEAKLCPPTH